MQSGPGGLFRQYEANQVAADAKYEDRILQVTGIVDSIGKDILGRIYITFKVDGEQIFSVQCFFEDRFKDEVARLKKGQKTVLIGKCRGKLGNVLLVGCHFE